MENYFRKLGMPLASVLLGGLALTACVNDDYDFNEIDSTMGFGGDGLELPASSTDTIKLVDVLDLNDDDCVKVRPNGDYVFEQEGGNVEPSRPEIDTISVKSRASKSHEIPLEAVPGSGSTVVFEAEGDMQTFEYKGDKPEEVVLLESAESDAPLSFTLGLSALSRVVSEMEEVVIEFPSYMQLGSVNTNAANWSVDGSKITFANVSTASDLHLEANVSNLTFGVTGERGSLTVDYDANTIDLVGSVHVSIRSAVTSATTAPGAMLGSSFTMDDFDIMSVTGRFDPEIDLTDLGDVEITGVPDFLDDEDVRVDLYNPQIFLTITSDLSMGGFVSGVLTSWKDGVAIATVNVPEMAIQAGGETNVCICRRDDDMAGFDGVVQEVPELSKIIERIPDRITFSAEARADASQTCEFELGRRYTITPKYKVEAPIAFAAGAQIVYKDTIDDWNEDIDDFDLSEDAYIALSATIENRVPAFLTLSAYAIDVDGQRMADDEISVEVSNTVIASADGVNSVETPLNLKVTQGRKGAMKRLDGLVFDIKAAASDNGSSPIEGMTLNSQKHFLIARDIKIKLVGKLIGDFN